ncbi:MAG: hypothetical protein DDT41_01198 [candidate division WS2 bacterium]|nr:hypothetical protein [Candidatus Psychracetigena formicireducens]
MSNNNYSGEPEAIYQINVSDIGPIFIDYLKLTPSVFCPFEEELRTYSKGSSIISDGALGVVKDDDFINALKIIAKPDYRLEIIIGGGMVPLNGIRVYASKKEGMDSVVSVSPGFENSHLLQFFKSPANFAQWFTEVVAGNVEDTVQNFMPPPLTLGGLLYVLQVIDAFRRVSYQNLLDFKTTNEPYILTDEFQSSMIASMKSLDLRWLLPSFIALMPGLNEINWELKDEELNYLGSHDFLIPAKEQGSNRDIFLFGEAGTVMGSEFFRSWISSAGYRVTVANSKGEQMLEQGYMSFTALANHFFRIEKGNDGVWYLNHQPLTTEGFLKRLNELLLQTLKYERISDGALPISVAPVKPPVSEIPTTSQISKFCTNCGAKLLSDSSFCTSCGKKIS